MAAYTNQLKTIYCNFQHSPIRKKTLALCRTKSNSSLLEISKVPLAVCRLLDFKCWNNSNKLGSSFSGSPTGMECPGEYASATSLIGVWKVSALDIYRQTATLTIETRTARSRRPRIQKHHEASHRWPPAKAIGNTKSPTTHLSNGPSVPPSTALASATAICQSSICRRQTLRASFGLPANMKKAAAYSTLFQHLSC